MQLSRDYLHKSLSHFESQYADKTQIPIKASVYNETNDIHVLTKLSILYNFHQNLPTHHPRSSAIRFSTPLTHFSTISLQQSQTFQLFKNFFIDEK